MVKFDHMGLERRWLNQSWLNQLWPRDIWLGGALVLILALAYHLFGLATVPPGLDRDAAANGWLALNWLRYGIVPFWMPHASAPEPLIVWLQSATTALMGPSVVALRSASALFLSLAALVVYLLTLEVAKAFPAAQRFWAALLAGVVFACNPVVTQLARTGLRASTLPLLSALFFLCLLRAWRTNARRDYLIAGLVFGLSAYSYLAARFLPIVLAVFVLVAWWVERPSADSHERKKRWIGLGLLVGSALVVLLPQLFFFAAYPSAFWERAESVTILANPEYSDMGLMGLVARKVWALLLSFGIEWSGQYNQAALPLLSPLPFVGLLLALPVIVHWRRQAGMVLMVVAWVVMLLPDLIGGDRLLPHELRVIGAFVPTMVFCGIGLAYGLGWLVRWADGRLSWRVAGALSTLLIAGWGIVSWFGVAAPALAQSGYDWFARSDVAMAEAINRHEGPLLVPLNEYSRSVIAYLTSKRVHELRSGIGVDGQVMKPSAEKVALLWPADPERPRVESTSYRFDPRSLVLIDGERAYLMPRAQGDVTALQRGCEVKSIVTDNGQAAGLLCEMDFDAFGFPAEIEMMWPVSDLYNGQLLLQGVSTRGEQVIPGATLGVTSYWQAQQQSNQRWRYFVHLLDDEQKLVAGDDLMPGYGVYESALWQENEIVPIRQVLQVPDDLVPGRYWIEIGLYDPLNGERALVSGTDADRTLVGPLDVALGEGTELPAGAVLPEDALLQEDTTVPEAVVLPQDAVVPLPEDLTLTEGTPLSAHFGEEIRLDGFRLAREENELVVTLWLAALHELEDDYTIFLHVEDEAGELVAQRDAQPLDGQYPTSIWNQGEEVIAEWRVALPETSRVDNYRVWLGLYNTISGERLPILSTDALVDSDRLLLREVEVP